MRRKILLAAVFMTLRVLCQAQTFNHIEAIMSFFGAASPEELDSEEVERLSYYLSRPLQLNILTRGDMESSGILSCFQAASVVEYRKYHGDILSFNELASLDGFNIEIVERLKPFISIQGGSLAPQNNYPPDVEVGFKGGYKMSPLSGLMDGSISYGVKFKVEKMGRYSISLSTSRSSSASDLIPDTYSGNIAYTFRKVPLRVIFGDFNARFAQGLTLWNGMSMSGLNSPSAFVRNQTGVKPTWSYTGSSAMTGAAAEAVIGRVKIIGMLALPGCKTEFKSILPALNISWYGRNVRCGVTHYSSMSSDLLILDMKTAADITICTRGVDLFSEVSYDWGNVAVATLGGVRVSAGDLVLASMVRYYHPDYRPEWSGAVRSLTKCSNEYGASISAQLSKGRIGEYRRHIAVLSLDGAYLPVSKQENVSSIQVKSCLNWTYMVTRCLQVDFKYTERYRTWGLPLKSDVRLDICYNSPRYVLSARMNFLKYRKQAYLSYLEGGYLPSKLFATYLKQGFFIIDNWDDRIYSYERDAPGNYNVPAFYGRGLWTSVTISWKFSKWGKFYARGSITSYPFMKEEKPGKAELKVQCVFSL